MKTKIIKKNRERGAFLNKDSQYKEGLKTWVSYWRKNVHRFIMDYFECHEMKPFQNIILWLMSRNVVFIYVASRGQGKTQITAWFSCAMAVLYSGIEIVVTSGTKGQAKLIVTAKIEKFAEKYPNLQKEIYKIVKNTNETVVYFKNGSTITCVSPTENSRGYRGNLLVIDEFRMVKKNIIDTVLKNFLTSNRSPRFLTLPKYSGFPIDSFEPNREIYMSSAWFKNHWSWDKFTDTINAMTTLNKEGTGFKNQIALSIPYTAPLYHGILPLSKVENDMEAGDFSPVKFLMEMEAQFWGESENAFYKFEDIDKAMNLTSAFIPYAKADKVYKGKKLLYDFNLSEKEDGEIRIISVDVAGTGSDNDVIVCIRCIPEAYGRSDNQKYYYRKEIVYIKHISVAHSEIKARILKKLKIQFQADFVVMDTMGTSSSLYEACSRVTYNDDTGEEFPAYTAMNDEKLDSIKMDENAEKIIFSVRAFAQFNNDIAVTLRDEIKAGRLHLLTSKEEAESDFSENIDWYSDMSLNEQIDMMLPFDETYMAMIELTNLEAVWSDKGLVCIEKPAGGKIKRDRYTAIAYGIWYACQLEKQNLNKNRKKKKSNLSSYLFHD